MRGEHISKNRSMRYFYFAVLSIGLFMPCGQNLYANEQVELSIQLLTNELVLKANIGSEELGAWGKNIISKAESIAGEDQAKRDIAILITVHKNNNATITVSARPKSSTQVLESYQKELQKITIPNSRYCDYSVLFMLQINGGCQDTQREFTPPIITPDERNYRKFTSASLQGKKDLLQNWAEDQVIPILGHYTSSVDAKFKGVLAVGKILKSGDYTIEGNISQLTDKNLSYWRAVVEMGRGNQLIPSSKIFMHVVIGEFDIARRYLQIIRYFCDESSLATHYLSQLNWRIADFYEDHNKQIQIGIKLHDKQQYQKAIEQYKEILKVYPKSAWANYELYLSEITPSKDFKRWTQRKDLIYSCDPLYSMSSYASTGREGYMLFRRKEIDSLFKDRKSFKQDITRYADIALDLEEYGFAAQLYWLILTSFEKESYDNKNILTHFLYCLNKFGDTVIIQDFKGDFQAEFKKIEEERLSLMKESIFFTAFVAQNNEDAKYAKRGNTKRKKGDHEGAIADYTKAIEINPKYVDAYIWRGLAKHSKGDYDGAIADYTKAIEIDPKCAGAYINLGNAKYHKGDYDAAIADYTRAIEINPTYADAYDNRGYLHYNLTRWTDALSDFRKAIKLKSGVSKDYTRLRVWLIRARLGQRYPANKELSAHVEKHKLSADEWYAKICAFLLGKINEEDFVKAAADEDPKKANAQKCEAYFYAGTVRLLDGDKDIALVLFRQCIGTGVKRFSEYGSAKAEINALLIDMQTNRDTRASKTVSTFEGR